VDCAIVSGSSMATSSTRVVSLALHGGGAHGAFGWGVLDRLLEDGRIDIEGISGTSAGSMNAVVLAYGLIDAGMQPARLYMIFGKPYPMRGNVIAL